MRVAAQPRQLRAGCSVNRSIDIDIFGFIPSASGNEVMIDIEQRVTPWLWLPFLPPIKIWCELHSLWHNSSGDWPWQA